MQQLALHSTKCKTSLGCTDLATDLFSIFALQRAAHIADLGVDVVYNILRQLVLVLTQTALSAVDLSLSLVLGLN